MPKTKVVDCACCRGTGKVKGDTPGLSAFAPDVTCPACKGSGKQRV